MKTLKRGSSGPLLPAFQVQCDRVGCYESAEKDYKVDVRMDGMPLFTAQIDRSKADEIGERLVPKPKPCMGFVLDYNTRTMGFMDMFAEKVQDHQDWLEIRFKHPITLCEGRIPSFAVLSLVVGNVISTLQPKGVLSLTNLRRQNAEDDKYWEFVRFVAKELSVVWRNIPVSVRFYFKFRDHYVLKAKDHEELDTMKVGGAGSYRIVGMVVRRLG